MPRGDRSGPEGMGPRTGRALGYCSGNDRPGYLSGEPGMGMGRGFGRGTGFAGGRGYAGRGFGHGFARWNSRGYGGYGFAYNQNAGEAGNAGAVASDNLSGNLSGDSRIAALLARVEELEKKLNDKD